MNKSDLVIKPEFMLVDFSEGEHIMRKIIPGWRYFLCEDCNYIWREKCRDVESPSQSSCISSDEECVNSCEPVGWAYHPEWPIDKSGNLIDE